MKGEEGNVMLAVGKEGKGKVMVGGQVFDGGSGLKMELGGTSGAIG